MVVWAGIDEAGYGPPLGPLVVAGTAFSLDEPPAEGILWTRLAEAVARHARGSDGRLVVNDSKQVYSPAQGLKRLEDAVLAFLRCGAGALPERGAGLFEAVACGGGGPDAPGPWFAGAGRLALPVASNLSAVASKASVLQQALAGSGVRFLGAWVSVVLPSEFNRIVARTRNKSLLLFQKCGLILQDLWQLSDGAPLHVLIDKHGARRRYRRLLLDAFPHFRCDVLAETPERSAYRLADPSDGGRALEVAFQEGGDALALPAALASMAAKYVRELYMLAFNAYWRERLDGLKPTAGYHRDAQRFLREISPVLRAEQVDLDEIVRRR